MKRKTIIALFLYALCLPASQSVKAQDETPETFKHTLAIQPLYWVNNGLRIDYDKQLHNPRSWLQISAIGYHADKNDFWIPWMPDQTFNRAWGAGLEVNYKWFVSGRQRLYLSGGLAAAHFNVSHNKTLMQYIGYEEDNLTYYEPHWIKYETSLYFNRLGTNFSIGIQNRPTRRFLLDCYAGIGHVHTFYNRLESYPDNYYGSLTYQGLTLTLGLRIGFRL
jgi:hypothetical protein